MNPNVINIFSNDDLIKSIEIDNEAKNNNTNSFDELLHKVDSEKIFSEAVPNNIRHEKTEVENKTSYSFCGCTVSPGFDFRDFEMPSAKTLSKIFPQHQEIIKRLIINR